MHYFCGQRFFNGPETDSRAVAMIRGFVSGHTGKLPPLYIITSVKKRDNGYWETLLKSLDVDVDVTVDSWHRLSHYKNVTGSHFLFDGDNIYSTSSKKWRLAFLEITKANNAWSAAAEYTDDWYDFIWLFIACGFYKNKMEFEREHVTWKYYSHIPTISEWRNVAKLTEHLDAIRVLPPYREGQTDE